MIGTLEIKNIDIFAHHGCFEQERKLGNNFIVNFSCTYDMSIVCERDNIEDAVDYPKIYGIIKNEMAIESHLLEHLAKRILDSVKLSFPQIISAQVSIDKLFPPIGGSVGASSVTLAY